MVCICGLYEKTAHFLSFACILHTPSNSYKFRIKYDWLSEYLCAREVCIVWMSDDDITSEIDNENKRE